VSRATLVALTGGKGAPGATWCTANLGVALARAGHDVLAIDLDPSGGVLGAYLGLGTGRGLWPLCRTTGPRPMAAGLEGEIEQRHGLKAIAGVLRATDAASVDPVAVADTARDLAALVLVDVGRLPGPPEARLVAAACDRILLVVDPTPVGMLAAEQALAHLGDVARRVALVVSGLARRRGGDLVDVRTLLSRPVAGTIPLVAAEARRAIEGQRPVAGAAARAFADLAAELAGPATAQRAWRFGFDKEGVGDAV
jgi:MinD-like ATPase involved in chromosome partitioning or flagellar assembly